MNLVHFGIFHGGSVKEVGLVRQSIYKTRDFEFVASVIITMLTPYKERFI